MKDSTLDRQIETARECLEAPRQGADELPEWQEELSTPTEELQVGGEELRQQNEELAAAHQAVAVEVERQHYQGLFEFAQDGYLFTDASGIIQEANCAASALFNVSQGFLVGKPLIAYVTERDRNVFHAQLTRLQVGEKKRIGGWEVRLQPRNAASFPAAMTAAAVRDAEGHVVGLHWLLHAITERKYAQGVLWVSRHFLEIANRNTEMVPLLKEYVAEVKNFTGCAAVGLRLLSEEGGIPYQAYQGFTQSFYESESLLLIQSDRCMCVNVIKGEVDPKLPFYTKGGSFYINGTTRFLATVSEEEKGQTRNVCNQYGYESVALIPIRLGGRILGLIHVADPRENMVSLEKVKMLEGVGMQLGTAIQRVQAEEALRKAHDELETRVQERTRELAKATDELLALRRAEGHQRQLTEAVIQATLALNSSLKLDEVLDRILEQIQRVISCRAVAIMLIQDEKIHLSRHRGLENLPEACDTLRTCSPLDTFPFLKTMSTSRQQVLIADAQSDLEWRCPPGFEWVGSYAAVPMQAGEWIIGFLNIFSEQPSFFSQEITGLLKAFAAHAVVAIQNAMMYEAELHARQVAETLSSASRALTQTLNLDKVMNTLLDYLGRLVPYDSATVMLPQDQTRLAVRAVHGYERWTDPQEILAITIDAQASPPIHALLTTQKSVLISDTRTYPDWEHPTGAEHALSWLGVPLVAGDKVIGLCGLDKTKPGFFTPQHLQLAEALVGQTAVAIQNAWLFEQVCAGRERLQSLSHRLVEVQEAERRYIAHELHDEAGQALTSLMVGLRLLEREAKRPEAIIAGVAELKRMVDSVSENLHRLAWDLRPASLDHLGLVATLRQYAEAVSDKHGLMVQFETVGFDNRLPLDVETALYRIVQEALTNVIRHARATRVDVLLKQDSDKLIVIVEDNGVGFDPMAAMQSGRLGLPGMRERADMLGGTLVLESAAGTGTTLLLEVPYGDSDTHRG